MNFAMRMGIALLAIGLVATGIGVVVAKQEARSLFIQLQGLNGDRDALEIEWGQLKLEQSAWSTHGRVEQTARVGLRMVIPRPDEVRLVKPTPVSQ
ncbi:MAG TPA: cell division protein FtsL [Steroidobacteraceae bacterium]|nr:cell division protein FtsL [Steroidobacteraceae bacterium]